MLIKMLTIGAPEQPILEFVSPALGSPILDDLHLPQDYPHNSSLYYSKIPE